MNTAVLQIYHRLPTSLRFAAASLRGLYLNFWRYGPETEALVAAALEKETWSPARREMWQQERMSYVLHRAATRVPYYREQWAARRRSGDRASWEYLENWPILKKESFRRNARRFIADDCNPRYMYREHTSGTTGTPLELWCRRSTLRAWYALCEARIRRWNGVSRHDHWAILGGQPVVPADTTRPPFWIWNPPMKQLYLSANHLSRRNVAVYMDALRTFNVTHLVSYSSSAAFLAREALDLGLRANALKLVVTNAEPLFPWQRGVIREGLNVHVREAYGMAEYVATASECESGRLHLWPEVGWVEVLADAADRAVTRDIPGRLVCTGLLNADMPLVRYEVGDRGRLTAEESDCPCGRKLSCLGNIEGRTNDFLVTKSRQRVYWVNPVFYGLPVREAQVVQDAIDRIRIRYVPAAGFTQGSQRLMTKRLQQRMGPVEVVLEALDSIPRGPNGKFRAVVCNIPSGEREHPSAFAGVKQETAVIAQ